VIIVSVDVMAGTDIKEAVEWMIEFSKKTDSYVKTDFNGFDLFVSPVTNEDIAVSEYHRWINNRHLQDA